MSGKVPFSKKRFTMFNTLEQRVSNTSLKNAVETGSKTQVEEFNCMTTFEALFKPIHSVLPLNKNRVYYW